MIVKYEHLMGKKFIHGTTDCYSLLRDLYKDNLGIELGNYGRQNDWWLNSHNLYADNFSNEGFINLGDDYPLRDVRPFDVFLVALPDPRADGPTPPNHCCIYIGDGEIIHHRFNKLSRKAQYKGMMRDYTTHILRHKDVKWGDKPEKEVDIRDLLLPHKRREIEDLIQ